MTNTKINSAGILIFDNETQESLVGDSDPMIAMLPDGGITIDSDLLPSINVEDDLSEIARGQAQAKFVGVNELLAAEVPDNYIDIINQMSEHARPGQWLRYDFKSEVYSYHDSIDESEQALVYDCETFVKTGNYPIVAQAMSSKALWCWLHQSWDGTTPYTNTLVSIGSGQRTLVAHNCVPGFTNVITKRGLLPIADVKVGDYVLGSKKDAQSWVKVLSTISKSDQEVIEFGDSHGTMHATADHRWYCQKRGAYRRLTDDYDFFTTTELLNSRYQSKDLVISNESIDFPEGAPISLKECQIIGWIMGDGSYRDGVITQSSRRNAQYCLEIQDLFNDVFGDCKVRKCAQNKGKNKTGHPSYYADYIYRFYTKLEYWRNLCNRAQYFEGKETDFILSLNKSQLLAFLDAFWKAEGSKDMKYLTSFAQNPGTVADAIEIAGVLLGYRVHSRSGKKRKCKSINFKSRVRSQMRKFKVYDTYISDVYCLTTESGNFVMEQDGMYTVTGNCAFDFCRLLERFQFDTPIAVIDTMSIINCLHGMDSSSRWVLNTPPGKDARADRIRTLGCAKSLVASYNFCVAGPEGLPELQPADKKSRNIFVQADDFGEFIENRDELLSYSMLDIIYTFRLFKSIYRKFLAWSNGYEVLLGHSYTSEALLPVTEDREAWIAKCDDLSELAFAEINAAVFEAFTELHDQWLAGHPVSGVNVDWKLHKPKGWRKRSLPEGWPRMAKWYVRFLSNDLGVTTLDFSRLLQLEYYDQDRWCTLEHHRSYGWHFKNKHGEATRVPHANGSDDNVGNIISSDSLRFFDDFDAPILRSKTLDYNSEALYYILRLCDSVTTWRGFRERIVTQITHDGI